MFSDIYSRFISEVAANEWLEFKEVCIILFVMIPALQLKGYLMQSMMRMKSLQMLWIKPSCSYTFIIAFPLLIAKQ